MSSRLHHARPTTKLLNETSSPHLNPLPQGERKKAHPLFPCGRLNERKIEIGDLKILPTDLTDLLKRIDQETISVKMAKEIFAQMAETGKTASQIINEKGLAQITDEKDLS